MARLVKCEVVNQERKTLFPGIFRAVSLSKLISSNGKSGSNSANSKILSAKKILNSDIRRDQEDRNEAATNANLVHDDAIVRNSLDRRKSVENVSRQASTFEWNF